MVHMTTMVAYNPLPIAATAAELESSPTSRFFLNGTSHKSHFRFSVVNR